MRKIREVLRLKYACGASDRVEEIDDTALERKLFAPAGYNPSRSKPLPDWGHVHAELRRRGVTPALIARSVGIGRTAIAEYVRRAAVIGMSWSIPLRLCATPATAAS
jgi:transposase